MSTAKNNRRRRSSSEETQTQQLTKMQKTQRTPPNPGTAACGENTGGITKAWMQDLIGQHTSSINLKMEKLEEKIEAAEYNLSKSLEAKINELQGEITVLKSQNASLAQKIERMDREQRKNKIMISDLKTGKDNVQKAVSEALVKAGVQAVTLKDIREIKSKTGSVKFIGTCDSIEDKTRIKSVKKRLTHQGAPFYINDDLTPIEAEIQYHLRKYADSLGPRGTASVAYNRVFANGKCYTYNLETKEIVEIPSETLKPAPVTFQE